jgi:hypothetical protein
VILANCSQVSRDPLQIMDRSVAPEPVAWLRESLCTSTPVSSAHRDLASDQTPDSGAGALNGGTKDHHLPSLAFRERMHRRMQASTSSVVSSRAAKCVRNSSIETPDMNPR